MQDLKVWRLHASRQQPYLTKKVWRMGLAEYAASVCDNCCRQILVMFLISGLQALVERYPAGENAQSLSNAYLWASMEFCNLPQSCLQVFCNALQLQLAVQVNITLKSNIKSQCLKL